MDNGEGFIHALHERKVSNEGVLIATLPASEQREANAAHIVRCVNSHAALVEALKLALQNMADASPSVRSIINEALTQAEKGE